MFRRRFQRFSNRIEEHSVAFNFVDFQCVRGVANCRHMHNASKRPREPSSSGCLESSSFILSPVPILSIDQWWSFFTGYDLYCLPFSFTVVEQADFADGLCVARFNAILLYYRTMIELARDRELFFFYHFSRKRCFLAICFGWFGMTRSTSRNLKKYGPKIRR